MSPRPSFIVHARQSSVCSSWRFSRRHEIPSCDDLAASIVHPLCDDSLPGSQGKYTALKALLPLPQSGLRNSSLSQAHGEHVVLVRNGWRWIPLHLRLPPPTLRCRPKDYCSLAEEADHILQATRSFVIQAIVPDSPMASPMPPPILPGTSDLSMVAGIVAPRKGDLFLATPPCCLCSFKAQGNEPASALQRPQPLLIRKGFSS